MEDQSTWIDPEPLPIWVPIAAGAFVIGGVYLFVKGRKMRKAAEKRMKEIDEIEARFK